MTVRHGGRLAVTARLALPAALLGILLYAGFRRMGPVPALGPFLNPVHGVWGVAAQHDVPPETIAVPGMRDTVSVVFDRRGVPHIFATSEEDAARALGYLHAYYRLFQMELQVRAAAGRLSEWLGRPALSIDRQQRRIGLQWAAERERAAMDTASEVAHVMAAYVEGINARIAELGPRDWPFEYHLLGVRPTPWDVLDVFLFGERMGYTLSFFPMEETYARLTARFGPAVASALLPVNSPIQEPIVPSRRPMPALDRVDVPGPGTTGTTGTTGGAAATGGLALDPSIAQSPDPSLREASNNWVVSGRRTATGHPLLAGDPHLDLTLPSIWYEAHLVVPGRLDVYGVTFPGAPAVAIGFNRDVAWSFTNTGADAMDLYRETLDDLVHPMQYRIDGAWQPLSPRVEVYWDPGGRVLAVDTVFYTHRGPVIRDDSTARSLRWTVLEGEGAMTTLWSLGASRSVDDWLTTMRGFRAPIQNGVVADRAGDIAELSAGRYPIRPAGGDGRTIWDGSTSASDWSGELPPERQPHARNPAQGYLASANQQPIDPRQSSDYLGADWPAPWRAMRINELLRGDSAVTVDDMRRFQTDPGNARTDWFLPAFLDAVVRARRAGRASPEAIRAAELLAKWDRRYTVDNTGAVLFEAAMRALPPAVWDEMVSRVEGGSGYPSETVLAALLAAPNNPWWDDRRTPDVVEDRDAILVGALAAGFQAVRERYGEPDAGGWRWGNIGQINIWHPLRVPALSALGIPAQGGPGTLNPVSGFGTHGASWRMVVSVGPTVEAWGVYPGGQSGNPLSRWYRDRLPTWAAGTLDPLPFPVAPGALPDSLVAGRTRMIGAGR